MRPERLIPAGINNQKNTIHFSCEKFWKINLKVIVPAGINLSGRIVGWDLDVAIYSQCILVNHTGLLNVCIFRATARTPYP
jgi:hypothetical protein